MWRGKKFRALDGLLVRCKEAEIPHSIRIIKSIPASFFGASLTSLVKFSLGIAKEVAVVGYGRHLLIAGSFRKPHLEVSP